MLLLLMLCVLLSVKNTFCSHTHIAIQAAALTFDSKVLDGEDILHLRYVGPALKLFLAPVPLVDDRPLGAAGQDQVRLVGDLQIFHVCVPVPRME